VLGLRKGEALGLIWEAVFEDTEEIDLAWQLQRVWGALTHKPQLKADGSTDTLPLPPICLTALQIARRTQVQARRDDVHPRVAMQILRHSRIALTMEIYTQVRDEVTRAALKRLSDWLVDAVDPSASLGWYPAMP